MTKATVRLLRVRPQEVENSVVAGAVAFKAGQPDPPGWELFEGLGEWQRELEAHDLEAEPALVGAGAEGWE